MQTRKQSSITNDTLQQKYIIVGDSGNFVNDITKNSLFTCILQ